MALIINKVLETRFELQYNGGAILSANRNNFLTDGDYCHFKTSTGANIIKEQNIHFSDVTIIDTYGGTGTFTFANIQSLWAKLVELNFEGLGGTGGSGSTTFQALLDTPTYFGNNGKTLIANESEQKLEYVDFYNINKFTDLSDVEIASLIEGKIIGVTLVSGVPKITLVDKPTDGTTYFSAVGGFDYNDLATQTTPLSYTTGDLQLTNDTLGAFTFLEQPPYGITSVWDESTNTLNFSQLSIGDEVYLRVHINITTTVSNQISGLKILFGEGTSKEYLQPIDLGIAFKTAGSHDVLRELKFYIGNTEWKDTPAKILFTSDANASIKVYGWHPYIIRKSINILDVSSSPLAITDYLDAHQFTSSGVLSFGQYFKYDAINARVSLPIKLDGDDDKTYVGDNCGSNNTGNYFSGSGSLCGYQNTGDNFTGSGYRCGYNNASYVFTGSGSFCGDGNTGNYFTGSGSLCGYQNTGINFVGSGYRCGDGNTGDNFTGSGYRCGYNNIGNLFTGSGYRCGDGNTGDYFTGSGYLCGYQNTGINFVGSGYRCGDGNTGDNFTGSGYRCGYQNTGINFVGSGYRCGDGNTFNNVTVLGAYTSATKDNQVVLGDNNVTEVLIGATLAIDKASIVAAADNTPLVVKTIGGIKTITV